MSDLRLRARSLDLLLLLLLVRRGSARVLAAQFFALLALIFLPASAADANWSTVSVSGPSGHPQSALTSVSCASAVSCIAVGTADDGGEELSAPENVSAFSERWDGSLWSVIPTADLPGSGATLLSVSCTSVDFCVAVGATHSNGRQALLSGPYGDARALVEIWNSSTWRVASSPAGTLPHSWLNGVTCVSASSCVAVGAHAPTRSSFGMAMIQTWNGRKWQLRHTPFVSKRGSELQGVSCSSPNACMAVGSYIVNRGPPFDTSKLLAERWNGRRWVVQRPPSGNLYGPDLKDVSCADRAHCMAVGIYLNGNGTVAPSPLVERWRQGRWRRATSHLPRYSSLEGVSCVWVKRCLAVGQFDPTAQPSPASTNSLVVSWNGSRWSREATPNVPAPTTAYGYWNQLNPALFGIACPGEEGCTAVGAQAVGSASAPLIQTTSEVFPVPTPPSLPAPTIITAPTRSTTSREALFGFRFRQGTVRFECRLSAQGVAAALKLWRPCTSPHRYLHLSPGEKRFFVRATNGTERSTAATWTWTIIKRAGHKRKPVVIPTTRRKAFFKPSCGLAKRCRARVTIKTGGKILARGRYAVPANSSRKVSIALTSAGRKALARKRRVRANLTIVDTRTRKRETLPVILRSR